jgi:hypothetical protein
VEKQAPGGSWVYQKINIKEKEELITVYYISESDLMFMDKQILV